MKAKYLLSHLKNLALSGQNAEGKLEWIGTREEWSKVETCPHCEGSGVVYLANGFDDVTPEICNCQ